VVRYCTAQDVRTYTGLSITDAPDADLEDFLDPATKSIVEQISVAVKWEILKSGGSGNTYYTKYAPIADTDGDMVVGTSEVSLYDWGNTADADSKVPVVVTAVSSFDGKITVSSTINGTVTGSYRYYRHEVDQILLRQATALYAGYLFTFTKWVWIPESYQLGPVRIRSSEPAWEKIFKMYVRVLNYIQRRPYAVTGNAKPTFSLSELQPVEISGDPE